MKSFTKLNSSWTFYLHLHDNREWNLESYIKILEFDDAESAILLNDEINYDLIKKSMIFVMRCDVKPMWEDENNKDGGCFSFKIASKDVEKIWKEVYYRLVGQSLTKEQCHYENINGITMSPKKKVLYFENMDERLYTRKSKYFCQDKQLKMRRLSF